MNVMEIIKDMKQCTGCGACKNICPVDAITMEEGHHTFLYPKIDTNKCIQCHKCQNVCPVNNYENSNLLMPAIKAASANDEVSAKSSSGGCFTVFSEYVIENGGCVFATTMDENLDIYFIKVETKEEISKCRGSKYVQSDTGFIYREVKEELEKQRVVAFFGCPCQISGLKNYLGQEYQKLYTFDLVCHGVPSQAMLHKYLEEKSENRIVESVDFRNKKHGWRSDIIQINYKNSIPYIRSWRSGDEWGIIFQENLGLRDSCENCKFCEFPRVGDLSIGDFWGVSDFVQTDISKGISMIMVNNEKGVKFLERIKEQFPYFENVDVQKKEIKNRIFAYYPHNVNKNLFFNLCKHHSFSESVKMGKEGRYDIGIVGIPTVENFGGSLTYVALFNVVKELGYTCIMIERTKDCIHPPTPLDRIYYASPFTEGELIDNVHRREELVRLSDKANKFLVGSDQLFHDNLMKNFSSIALLDWVSDNKSKIAYAASFGHDKFTGTEEKRAEMAYYMQKFDAFSVRENSGVEVAQKEFGVTATQVLDPVFLCDSQVYLEMVRNARKDYQNMDYIAAYILDPNEKKEKSLISFSQKVNLPLKIYSEFFYNNENIKKKWSLDIETWKIEDRLSCFYHSKCIVTDSFHGMCFAIIFKKNFIAIRNEGRGAARFLSLMGQIGLSERLICENEEIEVKEIDYESVYSLLNKEIVRSKQWLVEQLVCTNKKPFSAEDIFIKKLKQENQMLKKQLMQIRSYLGIDYAVCTNILEYIEQLNQIKEKLLIVITAKDTPGLSINEELQLKLQELGMKIKLTRDKHWCGYVAVLFRGTVVYENCELQSKVEYKGKIEGVELFAMSAPLHHGNDSITILNGKQYSVKSRGLNFVVYDLEKKKIADSVGFDTHHYLLRATRR